MIKPEVGLDELRNENLQNTQQQVYSDPTCLNATIIEGGIQESEQLFITSKTECLLSELQQYRFRTNYSLLAPKPIISIENHVIATPGNITTLVGQPKSGKSGVVAGILAGTLAQPGNTVDTLGFKVEQNCQEKAVIHIDGEQSAYDHYNGMNKVIKRANLEKEPEWFHSYNFKRFDIAERAQKLRFLVEVYSRRHRGVHMVIVDGGADFVFDTNDLRESNAMVHFFETLATHYNCVIVVVMHFNPKSDKSRGHFGSQLERKSESVIAVSKDKRSGVSIVKGLFLRNSGAIPELRFMYDEEIGYHVSQEGSRVKAENLKLIKLAESVFEEGRESYSYSELWKRIMQEEKIQERTAKDRVKNLLKAGVLEKSGGSSSVYSLCHRSENCLT